MNLWVYKVRNDPNTNHLAWGDWSSVFEEPWQARRWGGAWATAKPDGKRIFNEEMSKGDLILAWQSDRAAAIGLCEVVGWEESSTEGTDLVLRPIEVFARPVRLHDLKKTTHPELRTVASLKQGNAATIYPTTNNEARALLAACGSTHAL